MIRQHDCQARDATDPLRGLREMFFIPPGVIYLDGNSLGPMPRAAAARAVEVVTREWGTDLIRSWNSAGWFSLPQRLGDRIAGLIGAGNGEVMVTDSTSINLYKVLSAAMEIVEQDSPGRRTIVSESSNFPTDLYIAQGLCRQRGWELVLVETHELARAIAESPGLLMLTHVNYRTGAMHDLAAITAAAHGSGTQVIWDLAHSAGAVPVDLAGCGADFAVGCSYKYLNGGPGAPAFVWVHPTHADRFWQPLSGWWGHAAPFAFSTDYQPAAGIARYLCGTQPIVSMTLLECGLDAFDAAEALGGLRALRYKSLALTDLFIELIEQRCAGHGLELATPRAHTERGSQVSLTLASTSDDSTAYAIVQALIARGVIGDFRCGDGNLHKDILRFGFAPLYLSFEDVWQSVDHLVEVLQTQEWRQPQFRQKHSVT
jgi:kynureninase